MIKTKSILQKPLLSDGTRICIMRYIKYWYIYDEYIRILSPSPELLKQYKNSQIFWKEFASKYTKEMSYRIDIIKSLKRRSDNGETITLLCWEKDDKYCHRRLLKNLIDNCEN